MMTEGPFYVVGWGPFPLPGEHKRDRENERNRVEEVNAMKCLLCAQNVHESEWCMMTDDGEHRPTLNNE